MMKDNKMMTKRNFLIGGIASILATRCCPAIIIKSAIGGKGNLSSQGSVAKLPYVTKGLAAMWDGKWNAGVGVHDNMITDWVDLSGNNRSFHADAPIWSDTFC